MGKSTSFSNDMLLHFLNNSALANYGDATGLLGSSGAGSVYVALHTADPGVGGTQATSEVAYTGYARAAVARSSGGWTVTTNSATNAAQVNFPACTGGSAVATYFSIGITSSGSTKILYSAALTSSISISNNITPYAAAGTLTVTEN